MNSNLILVFLLNIWLRLEYSSAITIQDESLLSKELPIRNSFYMSPYREALENKVQLLMTQRRKPLLSEQSEKTDSTSSQKVSKTLGSSSSKGGIKKLSARRVMTNNEPKATDDLQTAVETVVDPPIETEVLSQVIQDTVDNTENYNDLFLELNELHTPSTLKVNQDFKKVEKVKSLSAKKPTDDLSSQSGSKEYFQSETFKKNKNRLKNPLREKRLQLLHDENFLQKHQALGQFIYSKNKESIGTNQMITTTSKNEIQTKQSNKKFNVKLNEFNGEKNTTFQNRLPNLRDSSSSNDVIFNAKERIEDLNTENNETKILFDDVNKLETQSSLLNGDLNPKKRFRDSIQRAMLPELENANTLSMHRNQFHNQFQHNPQLNMQHQNSHQGIDGIKKLSFGKQNTRAEYIPSNNYFETKERMRLYSNPNEEYARPSDLYQHRYIQKVSQHPESLNSQIQGSLPSGLHFKLLKNKKKTPSKAEESKSGFKEENINENDSHLLGENRERLTHLNPTFTENSKITTDNSDIDSVKLINEEVSKEQLNSELTKEEDMINKEDNQGLIKDEVVETEAINTDANSAVISSDINVSNEADKIITND